MISKFCEDSHREYLEKRLVEKQPTVGAVAV